MKFYLCALLLGLHFCHLEAQEAPLGYTSLTKEVPATALSLQGAIPGWVSGTYVFNGPALFGSTGGYFEEWLDGLAMLHTFSIQDGKVSYANKFLQSTAYLNQNQQSTFRGFFHGGVRGSIPNANINIARLNSSFVALAEMPPPVIFDLSTLDTVGPFEYADALAKSHFWECAHPHHDPQTGEVINFYVEFSPVCKYVVYREPANSNRRERIAEIKVENPSYMHSFAITQNYIILCEYPFVMDPKDFGAPFLKRYSWKKDLPLMIHLIRRSNGELIGDFPAEPAFAWHHINSFELQNQVIVDMACYSDASLFTLPNGPDPEKKRVARFTRYSISLPSQAAMPNAPGFDAGFLKKVEKMMIGPSIEMPRINYDRCNGKPYRYVYGVNGNMDLLELSARDLIKFDVQTGQSLVWSEPGCFANEPLFIPKPGATSEDDGVIVSVVLDTRTKRSFLLVLDGAKFNEIARASTPHHIPFGMHGAFFIK